MAKITRAELRKLISEAFMGADEIVRDDDGVPVFYRTERGTTMRREPETPDHLSVEAAGVLRALADYVEQGRRCAGYVVAIAKDRDDDFGDRIGIGGGLDVIQGLLDVTQSKALTSQQQPAVVPPLFETS